MAIPRRKTLITLKNGRLPPLIRALLTTPRCYGHAVTRIQLRETHISWVLLTGAFAYKIKKPLNLGFLNFSTLALRQQACEEEVRLNRRLASKYYLGVVAISGSVDAPEVASAEKEPPGNVIEYAVKMRQFPVEATLDRVEARGELNNTQIDQLAVRLAKFHLEQCDRATAGSKWGGREAITGPVRENFRLLMEQCEEPAERARLLALQKWSNAEYAKLAGLMQARKRNGMVRECHGDLHLGNLAWVQNRILLFDCIEFDPALRWIDVMSEVAFCFMDLLHRRHPGLAMRFLNAWLERSGDYEGVALLRYYVVYRALVRAKVAVLRAGQSRGDGSARAEASACIHLADQFTQSMPTRLCIMHGLSGSGKTTLSQGLLQDYGMIRIRSDVERKRLAGMDALSRSDKGIGQGIYSPEAGMRTYKHLSRLSMELLQTGWPVIVDAAFLERWQRDMFRAIAKEQGVDFLILDVQADLSTLRDRVRRRNAQAADASDADMRVLQHQVETVQLLGADELSCVSSMTGDRAGITAS